MTYVIFSYLLLKLSLLQSSSFYSPFHILFNSKTLKVSVSSVSNFPPSILSWTHSNPRFYLQLSEDMALIKVLKTSALLSQRSFLSSHVAQPIISIVHTHCVLFETVFLHWTSRLLACLVLFLLLWWLLFIYLLCFSSSLHWSPQAWSLDLVCFLSMLTLLRNWSSLRDLSAYTSNLSLSLEIHTHVSMSHDTTTRQLTVNMFKTLNSPTTTI